MVKNILIEKEELMDGNAMVNIELKNDGIIY